MPDEEFDGETPDQKRAAEKRKAALEASRVVEDTADTEKRESAPKGRRSKSTDEA